MKIRSYLVALILSVFVPFTIFAGVMAYMLVERERAATVEGLRSTARALAIAVDGRIDDIVNSLELLAGSGRLRVGNFQAFDTLVRRAMQTRPDWRVSLVADRNGQTLLNTAASDGTILQAVDDRAYFQAVLKTGAPVVAREAFHLRPSGLPGVVIAVPVFVAGELRYVLVAGLTLPVMNDIFAAQNLSDDWTGAIIDAGGTIIGRSRAPDLFVGQPATPAFAAAIRASSEGIVRDVTKEGSPALAAFARSERVGWTVGIGAAAATADVAAHRILLIVLAVGVGVSLLALALATVLGRRISRSVLALVDPAIAIGRGEPIPSAARSPVSEIQDVMDKLVRASTLLLERERERQTAEERYRLASRATNDIIWEYDLVTGRIARSANLQAAFGYPLQEDAGLAEWWRQHLHPEDRARVFASVEEVLSSDREIWSMEYRLRRADGTYAHIHDRAYIVRDAQGRPLRVVGAKADLTERKAVEDKLRESEAHLAQAKKMEALGQLTGGIAHDFNNLLAILMTNLELAIEEQKNGRSAVELNERCLRVLERGAGLTQRLLAFARRQALRPTTIELNDVVASLRDLVARSLGARIDVETRLLDKATWVELDRAQLESALVNLAVNARDAMPEGGQLVIALQQCDAGTPALKGRGIVDPETYICLSVADTGHGMAPEVKARIFEPFFTTKKAGKGSGLGLPIVYGFVEQSGGLIAIDSAPGQGTTVKLYFPRTFPPAVSSDTNAAPVTGLHRCPHVLVVEDEADLRASLATMLHQAGARVTAVPTADAGLAIVQGPSDIDILLTDIALPGELDGLALGERARTLRPALRIVFMSGRVEHLERLKTAARHSPFLAKPFRQSDLVAALNFGAA